jgi:aminopeptidase N
VLAVLMVLAAACGTDPSVRAGDASGPTPTIVVGPSGPSTTPGPSSPSTTLDPPTTVDPRPTPETTPIGPVTPGDGLGDEPFPELGNPGIDVTHYDVDLAWDQAARRLSGEVTVDLVTTEPRPSFTLDAAKSLEVAAVTLDGHPVPWKHESPELRITPDQPLPSGTRAEVAVIYSTAPGDFTGAGGLSAGWLVTDIGSYTLDEPDLARTWMPCDDHPSDKATWTFRIAVAAGATAVANGELVSHGTDATGGATWEWRMDDPMSTYLAQVLTGPYDVVTTPSIAGGPHLVSAVLPRDRAGVQLSLDQMAGMVEWFSGWFGPYPFSTYGIAVADSIPGLAMEEQTRSLFPRSLFTGGSDADRRLFLSHELAHQWFGDAVSPASWQDIWLNESFATYGEWMWSDHLGDTPLSESAGQALAGRRQVSPAHPGAELFGFDVYSGGAVVLQALRLTIGDSAFFALLKQWVADNRGTSRSTEDFIALAEKVSGRSLTDFFATWLYADQPPTRFP